MALTEAVNDHDLLEAVSLIQPSHSLGQRWSCSNLNTPTFGCAVYLLQLIVLSPYDLLSVCLSGVPVFVDWFYVLEICFSPLT